MFVIFSVFYILVAAAMTVLILLQNGEGASAGSGFGGGASATVFGARGSANFLTRATAVLATLFFALSLGMGVYLHSHGAAQNSGADLGVMAGMSTPAPAKQAAAAATPVNPEVPVAANNTAVPVAPAASKQQGEVPAAPAPQKKQ
ncbi:preprotein translocase subunit SecG [Rhodanobacter sp. DHB23]|uniref:preprotein translocase subunit SecG n=1 Tax=Rhodanobacter sp. DHB23 TaxID=2775923 RepID=UPI001785D20D|nr:preprotein translocase subunit SecG [Rhodanobacter sp. DHB23]MBD8873795.1 preprotein translocase subunit SecG [Rhodanobacter sp. DHB23]